MGLPINLAMTPAELFSTRSLPEKIAWMACHFSPYGEGLTNLPDLLPSGSMLILNDRMPCQGHSPSLVVHQLGDVVARLGCACVLLDFQRQPDGESQAMAEAVVQALPCPVAVSEGYAEKLNCPVFLPPPPLHVLLKEHLARWQGREVWLEAALCQEAVRVTAQGTAFSPQLPPDHLEGGFFDETLCCCYHTVVSSEEACFTLFDTVQSLRRKLELAASLGVTRAVGLYQEIGRGEALGRLGGTD